MVGVRRLAERESRRSTAPLSKRDIRAYRYFKRLDKKLSLPKAQRGKEIDNDSALEERWVCTLEGQSREYDTRFCHYHTQIVYWDNGEHEVRCSSARRECPHILHISSRLPKDV